MENSPVERIKINIQDFFCIDDFYYKQENMERTSHMTCFTITNWKDFKDHIGANHPILQTPVFKGHFLLVNVKHGQFISIGENVLPVCVMRLSRPQTTHSQGLRGTLNQTSLNWVVPWLSNKNKIVHYLINPDPNISVVSILSFISID